MAVTATLVGEGGGFTDRKRAGNPGDRLMEADVVFDLGVYATSGVAVPSNIVGANGMFTSVSLIQFIPSQLTYYAIYDLTTELILVYTRSNDTEVSNATDLTGVEFHATVKGLV